MKRVQLTIMFLVILFLTACVNKGELYIVSALEDIVYDISINTTEDLFCEKYAEYYADFDEVTEYGYSYLDCTGENGHYQYLKGLNLELIDREDIDVEVEEDNGVFSYYIIVDNNKVILGNTPNIALGDLFIIIEPDVISSIDQCLVITSKDSNEVGEINGYTIVRNRTFCLMVVGIIIVDGYNFGFFSSGCDNDINNIGYSAIKDGVEYNLKTLVQDGELTVKEIFELYFCDQGKLGSTI